jgi:hypothetical protein
MAGLRRYECVLFDAVNEHNNNIQKEKKSGVTYCQYYW